ncbi:hypothetical protein QA612_10765 [Evansella sp. AB-P1]|uniref:hypothetical protein n=1 Tax=Evansella sp. AB-P1 TaxID=3037653 RepID=UPI00241E5046|nr:hypothetical protein [Evansella sp. AB-P1]MDG5787970.1 hypothetical protein [Evansella sp. AB-P1]
MGGEQQNKSLVEFIYEGLMFILAFSAVATIWYQTQYNSYIVWGTWAIFFSDFLYRFFNTNQKWQFIKSNPFIVIAIIPLDAVFQLARIARLLHFLRLKAITKYYTKPLIEKLQKQRFTYLIPGCFLLLFISVIPLYIVEPNVTTYLEAFIGGLASLVFFGYSQIAPQTAFGTLIITLLTIYGVILHGLIIKILLSTLLNLKFVQAIRKKRSKQYYQ